MRGYWPVISDHPTGIVICLDNVVVAALRWRQRSIGKIVFEQIEEPNEKPPTDYTGLIFAAILSPVLLLFPYLGKADMGLTIFIILGMIMFAVKIRWRLRRHIWFWAIIAFILALHVPLLSIVRWPQGKTPTIAYSMPLGIADFLLIMGVIGLTEKFFPEGSSSGDEEG